MDFVLPFFISKLGVGTHNGTPRLELNQCFEENKIYFLLHQYFHHRWSVIRFTTTTTNICNWLNYLRIFVSQFLLICVHFAISQTQWKKKWRTNVNYICGYREKLKQENAFCLYDLLKYLRNPINCSQQNLAF